MEQKNTDLPLKFPSAARLSSLRHFPLFDGAGSVAFRPPLSGSLAFRMNMYTLTYITGKMDVNFLQH